MDTSPATLSVHSHASVQPAPPLVGNSPATNYHRARSACSSISQCSPTVLYTESSNWKNRSSYRSGSAHAGGLPMVIEELEIKSKPIQRNSRGNTLRQPGKKKSSCAMAFMTCLLQPLKKVRDCYVSCCFQIVGAGDLTGLVGGGHVAASAIDLFPVAREDPDEELNLAKEHELWRRS